MGKNDENKPPRKNVYWEKKGPDAGQIVDGLVAHQERTEKLGKFFSSMGYTAAGSSPGPSGSPSTALSPLGVRKSEGLSQAEIDDEIVTQATARKLLRSANNASLRRMGLSSSGSGADQVGNIFGALLGLDDNILANPIKARAYIVHTPCHGIDVVVVTRNVDLAFGGNPVISTTLPLCRLSSNPPTCHA